MSRYAFHSGKTGYLSGASDVSVSDSELESEEEDHVGEQVERGIAKAALDDEVAYFGWQQAQPILHRGFVGTNTLSKRELLEEQDRAKDGEWEIYSGEVGDDLHHHHHHHHGHHGHHDHHGKEGHHRDHHHHDHHKDRHHDHDKEHDHHHDRAAQHRPSSSHRHSEVNRQQVNKTLKSLGANRGSVVCTADRRSVISRQSTGVCRGLDVGNASSNSGSSYSSSGSGSSYSSESDEEMQFQEWTPAVSASHSYQRSSMTKPNGHGQNERVKPKVVASEESVEKEIASKRRWNLLHANAVKISNDKQKSKFVQAASAKTKAFLIYAKSTNCIEKMKTQISRHEMLTNSARYGHITKILNKGGDATIKPVLHACDVDCVDSFNALQGELQPMAQEARRRVGDAKDLRKDEDDSAMQEVFLSHSQATIVDVQKRSKTDLCSGVNTMKSAVKTGGETYKDLGKEVSRLRRETASRKNTYIQYWQEMGDLDRRQKHIQGIIDEVEGRAKEAQRVQKDKVDALQRTLYVKKNQVFSLGKACEDEVKRASLLMSKIEDRLSETITKNVPKMLEMRIKREEAQLAFQQKDLICRKSMLERLSAKLKHQITKARYQLHDALEINQVFDLRTCAIEGEALHIELELRARELDEANGAQGLQINANIDMGLCLTLRSEIMNQIQWFKERNQTFELDESTLILGQKPPLTTPLEFLKCTKGLLAKWREQEQRAISWRDLQASQTISPKGGLRRGSVKNKMGGAVKAKLLAAQGSRPASLTPSLTPPAIGPDSLEARSPSVTEESPHHVPGGDFKANKLNDAMNLMLGESSVNLIRENDVSPLSPEPESEIEIEIDESRQVPYEAVLALHVSVDPDDEDLEQEALDAAKKTFQRSGADIIFELILKRGDNHTFRHQFLKELRLLPDLRVAIIDLTGNWESLQKKLAGTNNEEAAENLEKVLACLSAAMNDLRHSRHIAEKCMYWLTDGAKTPGVFSDVLFMDLVWLPRLCDRIADRIGMVRGIVMMLEESSLAKAAHLKRVSLAAYRLLRMSKPLVNKNVVVQAETWMLRILKVLHDQLCSKMACHSALRWYCGKFYGKGEANLDAIARGLEVIESMSNAPQLQNSPAAHRLFGSEVDAEIRDSLTRLLSYTEPNAYESALLAFDVLGSCTLDEPVGADFEAAKWTSETSEGVKPRNRTQSFAHVVPDDGGNTEPPSPTSPKSMSSVDDYQGDDAAAKAAKAAQVIGGAAVADPPPIIEAPIEEAPRQKGDKIAIEGIAGTITDGPDEDGEYLVTLENGEQQYLKACDFKAQEAESESDSESSTDADDDKMPFSLISDVLHLVGAAGFLDQGELHPLIMVGNLEPDECDSPMSARHSLFSRASSRALEKLSRASSRASSRRASTVEVPHDPQSHMLDVLRIVGASGFLEESETLGFDEVFQEQKRSRSLSVASFKRQSTGGRLSSTGGVLYSSHGSEKSPRSARSRMESSMSQSSASSPRRRKHKHKSKTCPTLGSRSSVADNAERCIEALRVVVPTLSSYERAQVCVCVGSFWDLRLAQSRLVDKLVGPFFLRTVIKASFLDHRDECSVRWAVRIPAEPPPEAQVPESPEPPEFYRHTEESRDTEDMFAFLMGDLDLDEDDEDDEDGPSLAKRKRSRAIARFVLDTILVSQALSVAEEEPQSPTRSPVLDLGTEEDRSSVRFTSDQAEADSDISPGADPRKRSQTDPQTSLREKRKQLSIARDKEALMMKFASNGSDDQGGKGGFDMFSDRLSDQSAPGKDDEPRSPGGSRKRGTIGGSVKAGMLNWKRKTVGGASGHDDPTTPKADGPAGSMNLMGTPASPKRKLVADSNTRTMASLLAGDEEEEAEAAEPKEEMASVQNQDEVVSTLSSLKQWLKVSDAPGLRGKWIGADMKKKFQIAKQKLKEENENDPDSFLQQKSKGLPEDDDEELRHSVDMYKVLMKKAQNSSGKEKAKADMAKLLQSTDKVKEASKKGYQSGIKTKWWLEEEDETGRVVQAEPDFSDEEAMERILAEYAKMCEFAVFSSMQTSLASTIIGSYDREVAQRALFANYLDAATAQSRPEARPEDAHILGELITCKSLQSPSAKAILEDQQERDVAVKLRDNAVSCATTAYLPSLTQDSDKWKGTTGSGTSASFDMTIGSGEVSARSKPLPSQPPPAARGQATVSKPTIPVNFTSKEGPIIPFQNNTSVAPRTPKMKPRAETEHKAQRKVGLQASVAGGLSVNGQGAAEEESDQAAVAVWMEKCNEVAKSSAPWLKTICVDHSSLIPPPVTKKQLVKAKDIARLPGLQTSLFESASSNRPRPVGASTNTVPALTSKSTHTHVRGAAPEGWLPVDVSSPVVAYHGEVSEIMQAGNFCGSPSIKIDSLGCDGYIGQLSAMPGSVIRARPTLQRRLNEPLASLESKDSSALACDSHQLRGHRGDGLNFHTHPEKICKPSTTVPQRRRKQLYEPSKSSMAP